MSQRWNTSEFTVSGHSHLLCGEFPGPFWCEGLLLVFSKRCVRIAPSVDVFWMYLWEEANSSSCYSAILTPLPRKDIFVNKNHVVLAVLVTLAPIVVILLKAHSSCCRDFKMATISIAVIRSTVNIIYWMNKEAHV